MSTLTTKDGGALLKVYKARRTGCAPRTSNRSTRSCPPTSGGKMLAEDGLDGTASPAMKSAQGPIVAWRCWSPSAFDALIARGNAS